MQHHTPPSSCATHHHRFRDRLGAVWVAAGIVLLPMQLPAQATVRLSGYVRSAASGEVIREAQVLRESGASVLSNQSGFYVLMLPTGEHVIRVRAIGYLPRVDTLSIQQSTTLDMHLTLAPVQLAAVAVTAARDTSDVDPGTPEMSTVRLDSRTLKLTPVVLGEADPLRTLTLLPGVKPVADFSTGFSVRGGAPDQNLILLDEATIYNPSHVFGFFSVFNADAIADVKLYKGALPARYGGRLSSVLDIRQREGNAHTLGGQVTLGALASRGLLEGPLPGGKGSWLVAGRRTYADVFLKLSTNPNLRKSAAWFYDLNAKGNMRLGNSGTLMLSGYLGQDRYRVGERFATGWGNQSGTLRWNQAVGNRLFSNVTLTASEYDYAIDFLGDGQDRTWLSRIGNRSLTVNQQYTIGNGSMLEFGGEITRHRLQPGEVRPIGNSPVLPVKLTPRLGSAPAVHVSHEVEVSPRLSIRYGVRYAGFRLAGPGMVYRYQDDRPLQYDPLAGRYLPGVVVDSTPHEKGRSIASFGGLEPRASLRIGLSPDHSIKASYARTRQYLHLISNTNTQTPVDVWEPVGPYIRPQEADQVAVGYAGLLARGAWELSIEGYSKTMRHVTDLVDGANITLNDRLETEVLQGSGRAYGMELLVRRREGRLTGWLSYTISRTERRLPGIQPSDPGVNGGAWYPAPYDRTHDLSLVGFYPLNAKWTLGGAFALTSGLPATLPNSRYLYHDLLMVEYGPRNASRLPAYHRLDLTLTRTSGRKEWQFGVFNVYNRFNAQSVSFRPNAAQPRTLEAIQSAVFGIVPSVNFSFRF